MGSLEFHRADRIVGWLMFFFVKDEEDGWLGNWG